MISKGQKVDWRLGKERGLSSLLFVWGMCGVLLQSVVASATPASGVMGSILAASREVPTDLIIAVSIFVAMFILRMGRVARRQPVRQERPRNDRDRF